MILYFLKNHFIYYNRSNSFRPPRPPPSRPNQRWRNKKYIAIFFFHPIAKKTKQTKRMKVKSLTILLSIKVWLWRMERDGQLLSRTTVDMFSGITEICQRSSGRCCKWTAMSRSTIYQTMMHFFLRTERNVVKKENSLKWDVIKWNFKNDTFCHSKGSKTRERWSIAIQMICVFLFVL
jgi:hypothetical protein